MTAFGMAAGFALAAGITAAILAAGWRLRHARHAAERAWAEAIGAREKADAAMRRTSAFVATVSHEIRTPMNGVIGVIDILQETPLNQEQRHYLEVAAQSARMLLRVMNDILDFAKSQSGTLKLCDAPYDFYKTMEGLCDLFQPLARRKSLTLRTAVRPHFDQQLVGDEIRVSQIVANLLSNAIAFTEQGHITLCARRRLTRSGDWVEIAVHDTGAGMSAAFQERLFRPFHQEDGSTTRRHGGTGLGLAIVKQLVNRMGGHIAVHSRVGCGTSVHVLLPAHWGCANVEWPNYEGRRIAVEVCEPMLRAAFLAWARKAGLRLTGRDGGPDVLMWMEGGIPRIRSCSGTLAAAPPRVSTRVDGMQAFFRALDSFLGASPAASRFTTGAPAEQNLPRRGGARQRRASLIGAPAKSTWTPAALIAAAYTRGPARPGSERPAKPGVTLWLVEDNEINRDITLRQLALIGVTARCAEDGEAGFEAWLRHRPTAMLVDLHMPRLDGYGLARRIRHHESAHGLARTVIIGYSASAADADARACREAGMDDYVSKPATRSKLLAALRRAGLMDPDPSTHEHCGNPL